MTSEGSTSGDARARRALSLVAASAPFVLAWASVVSLSILTSFRGSSGGVVTQLEIVGVWYAGGLLFIVHDAEARHGIAIVGWLLVIAWLTVVATSRVRTWNPVILASIALAWLALGACGVIAWALSA